MSKQAKQRTKRTLSDLKLDVESATDGKTWLLLPEGYRDQECGHSYPLPTARADLQRLIAIPTVGAKRDSGTLYIKRAIEAMKATNRTRQSAAFDIEQRHEKIKSAGAQYDKMLKGLREQAKQAVEDVREEAKQATASLNVLFDLGREGIEGQMRAHLQNAQWKGEQIDARAFRECFRMVTQTVKGLGMPTTESEKAREAIVEEAAAAIRATQETVEVVLLPDPDKETQH